MMSEKKAQYKILSIDGGGIRGIIPLRVLIEFELRTGKPISELFDFITGVSVGSIIAAGLTLKEDPNNSQDNTPVKSAVGLLKDFINLGEKIFPSSSVFNDIYSYRYTKHNSENYKMLLDDYLGDYKLADTIIPIACTSLSLNTSLPYTWSTYKAKINPDQNYYLKDAILASSAAPTFFSAYKAVAPDKNNTITYHVDGGLVNNNPFLDGVTEFIEYHGKKGAKTPIGKENIFAVSIGTGSFNYISDKSIEKLIDAGKIQWMSNQPNVLDFMFNANSASTNKKAKFLFGENFYRFQIKLPTKHAELDNTNTDNICGILFLMERFILENDSKINEVLKHLDKDFNSTSYQRKGNFNFDIICKDYVNSFKSDNKENINTFRLDNEEEVCYETV